MMTESLFSSSPMYDDTVDGMLLPQNANITKVGVHGEFFVDCVKPDGSIRWHEHIDNGVTNVGFNLMLDSTFRSNLITPIIYWYIGLIGNAGGSTLAATDTMSSHAGWVEDSTHYTPVTYTAAVNNGGGYSAGSSSWAIDTIAQAIPNGTGFTAVGATGTYKVLTSTGGSTPTNITFEPVLVGSVANDAVITFNNARPLWTPAAAASKIISNTVAVTFPINLDSTVIRGIFVTSDPTLGGTSGTLWSTGLFPSGDQTLFNGDNLKITYQVTLS